MARDLDIGTPTMDELQKIKIGLSILIDQDLDSVNDKDEDESE